MNTKVTPEVIEPIIRSIITEEAWAPAQSQERVIVGIVEQYGIDVAAGRATADALMKALASATGMVPPRFPDEGDAEEDAEEDATLQLAAERLDAYLRARAEAEGAVYKLFPDFFLQGLEAGIRHFFGITVADGRLVSDEQQPRKDFFANWSLKQQPALH